MRIFLLVAFCLGGIFITDTASAVEGQGGQVHQKQIVINPDSPISLRTPLSSQVAIDVVVMEMSGSFVEVSESDLLLLFKGVTSQARPDSLFKGCSPILTQEELVRRENNFIQVL